MSRILVYLVCLTQVVYGLLAAPTRIMADYKDAGGQVKSKLVFACKPGLPRTLSERALKELFEGTSPWAVPFIEPRPPVPFLSDLVELRPDRELHLKNPTGNNHYDEIMATQICRALQVGLQVSEALHGQCKAILVDKDEKHVLGICSIPFQSFSYSLPFEAFNVANGGYHSLYKHPNENLPTSRPAALMTQCTRAMADCLRLKGQFQYSADCLNNRLSM